MSIRWDTRNKRWRFEFDRIVAGRRYRLSRLLQRGWSKAQAEAYDLEECKRLAALATGIQRDAPLIDQACALYLRDKKHLKSYKATAEHLASIAWAYAGRTLADLPEVAADVLAHTEKESGGALSPATLRNRLSVLKAACRWAWKRHGLTPDDPTARMILPAVSNERRVYLTRKQMLQACRACTMWKAQIAIRVAFYTGMRLGELWRVQVRGSVLVLGDTKNGDARSVPAHRRIVHLLQMLPLTGSKRGVQRAWERARDAVGLGDAHFHDLRHSTASEMINADVPLFVVGKVLGHRDPRSTARYSHLAAGTLADAIGQIGRR